MSNHFNFLCDKLTDLGDKEEAVGLIYFDFSKTLDIVPDDILISKLGNVV